MIKQKGGAAGIIKWEEGRGWIDEGRGICTFVDGERLKIISE